jgi:hypothetical protein
MKKILVYVAVPILYLLHQDWWFWTDHETRVLGMPIGLAYQVGFCIAASILMLGLVRFAWPAHLEMEVRDIKPQKADPWH